MVRAFNIDQKYLTDYNRKLAERVLTIQTMLEGVESVSLVPPEAGFFAFINISKLQISSNTFCSNLINKTGVATTPGIAFGSNWDDHIRISFATSDEILEKGMNLLFDFIRKY